MKCARVVLIAVLCGGIPGWFSLPARALGDTEAHDCAIAIAGSISDNSKVSNICGIPPETLDAIVQEFKESRKELKDLADERKQTVDGLKQTLDLTNGQIRAAFEILGEKDIPSERLAAKLVEIASRFKELQS